MRHWYVYHSEETMGRRYGRPALNRVFSTRNRTKLCLNDRIWVVEGVGRSPKRFFIAASFVYRDTHYPPFAYATLGSPGDDFRYGYSGPGQSFDEDIPLTEEAQPWFGTLHFRYITKQKFFEDVTSQHEIVEGLQLLVERRSSTSSKNSHKGETN